METQKIIQNDKQEWQQPVLEMIATEKTESQAEAGNDGMGPFTSS